MTYHYRVIDVREIDAELLIDSERVEESIFAILCKLSDQRKAVARILRQISRLPIERQREALAQLLILSGLRGLKALVKDEVKRMPARIDIHENEFLEEIWQEGGLSTAREMVLGLLDEKFGPVPAMTRQRIESADLPALQLWCRRAIKTARLDDVFA